ncbi:methyltransferase domain-containing protein [Paenibacillus sp. J5C_2022]|uniref:class I SAM-dependent methyltransferase n=1 Tax=Paenibacillus sp. J5C2022 TaxID=2977129 RepID=UPI0021D1DEE2|nr:methyltransferase domain-containing protein [Paenibacillus sp. J5C2022]MCU6707994.1 methyltransferase domain-containing protein [Paenibacillus sp. J5C2022]
MIRSIHEKLLFLFKFSNDPQYIGSVTPSSRHLAHKMVASVPWDEVESVVELGAGTGSVTRQIERASQEETKIILFEKDSGLRDYMAQQYPHPCYRDALHLQDALRNEQLTNVDCIISCLPFFNFQPAMRSKILKQINQSLRPEGWFIAFQYSLQMRKSFSQYFEIERIRFVLFNVPPAFVYVCRKKKE